MAKNPKIKKNETFLEIFNHCGKIPIAFLCSAADISSKFQVNFLPVQLTLKLARKTSIHLYLLGSRSAGGCLLVLPDSLGSQG